MADCFAAALGGCSGGHSLEHFVSANLLKEINATPLVEGWPGIADIKRVGVGALGSKILCKEHNYMLSPLDSAAGRFFEAIKRFDAELTAGNSGPAHVAVEGPLIELWLLKVALGLAAVNSKAGNMQRLRDHDLCVDVLYQRSPWPEQWGLYFQGGVGDAFLAPADLAVQTGAHPDTREVMRVDAWFRFLRMVLALGKPDGFVTAFRPGQISLGVVGASDKKVVELTWQDGAAHDLVGFDRVGTVDGWGQLPP
jgi:hypothetical protein